MEKPSDEELREMEKELGRTIEPQYGYSYNEMFGRINDENTSCIVVCKEDDLLPLLGQVWITGVNGKSPSVFIGVVCKKLHIGATAIMPNNVFVVGGCGLVDVFFIISSKSYWREHF